MPILSESAKVSIDFSYVWETDNGEEISYVMKFQHDEDGPIILISDGINPQFIKLPAAMFGDVYEFLSKQGALKVNSIGINKNVTIPTINKKPKENAPYNIGQRISKTSGKNVDYGPVAPISSFSQRNEEQSDQNVETESDTEEPEKNTSQDPMIEKIKNRAKINIEKKKIKTNEV